MKDVRETMSAATGEFVSPGPVNMDVPRPGSATRLSGEDLALLTQWAQKACQLPAVREDLVRRVKAEIAAGTYETPERLEMTVQRLMEDLL